MGTFQIDFGQSRKSKIVGIDLGTTNSLVAYMDLTGPKIIVPRNSVRKNTGRMYFPDKAITLVLEAILMRYSLKIRQPVWRDDLPVVRKCQVTVIPQW